MEATVVLVLVFTLVFGGMMLALVMGYRDMEDARAMKAAKAVKVVHPAMAAMIPGFFARPPKQTPAQPAIDALLLARLEQHVKAEHERVAEFVHYPSIENLYRKSTSSLHAH